MKRQEQAPAGSESEGPVDPASAFVDPLPLRENEYWDVGYFLSYFISCSLIRGQISTSFPYPRRAEFSSSEFAFWPSMQILIICR